MKNTGARFLTAKAALLHDLVMIPAAWMLAYWLRFNLGIIPKLYLNTALTYIGLVILAQAITCREFGLYRGLWRFASLPDLVRILKSVLVGTLIVVVMLFVVFRLKGVPRSVPVIYCLLLILLLSGPRFVYRWHKDHRFPVARGRRVLIVGAGQAGEMLVRHLLRYESDTYAPVGFVDDRRENVNRDLHGVEVLGTCDEIPRLVKEHEIDIILLATPSASREQKKRLIPLCEQSGVPFRTVPALKDLMSGQVDVNQVREVSIEDLLGREPACLDWENIRRSVEDRTILISGAGGSIGSELCRQIIRLKPHALVLVENCEFNLFQIEQDLTKLNQTCTLVPCLSDIQDAAAIEALFAAHQPDMIFHAAAYKHVPMLESQVREAVKNNVLGTCNLADAADRHGVVEFVMISTDKAVNPANIMGTTKRVGEIYCQNLNRRSKTRFVTVRFGNVLGSAGSVVPHFRKQIMEGGPVTVTHPDMERFFMTIPEACQLITQSAVLGEGGEIFVLDMGEPIKIQYLAEQMIRLSGKVPGEDIEIVYTGLRPGEKLYEELFHEQEALVPTRHEQIMLARHRELDWDDIRTHIAGLQEAVATCNAFLCSEHLTWFVPENRMADRGVLEMPAT